MRTVYANYCALVNFEVEDDTTDEEIEELIANYYEDRGFCFDDFDDGEWDFDGNWKFY